MFGWLHSIWKSITKSPKGISTLEKLAAICTVLGFVLPFYEKLGFSKWISYEWISYEYILLAAAFLIVVGLFLLFNGKIKEHNSGFTFMTFLVIILLISNTVIFSMYLDTMKQSTDPTPSPSPDNYDISDLFVPSGWMGDYNDISFDDGYREKPYSEPICIKITYSPSGSEKWAGIYWQYPKNNWGNNSGGWDISSKTKVTFFARGEKGGELAEFKVGGITGKYNDSIKNPITTGPISLSSEWQQYTIDLSKQNLEHVIGGFVWVTNKNQNPSGCTIYLDDMKYE